MTSQRLSVIVPVYNGTGTLARALNSVRSQTWKNIELIVVDGKSTDNSRAIAKEFNPDTLISEEDEGVYDAMNKGLEHATGDWVYFLGSDDRLAANDVVEKLLSQNPKTELICGKVKNVNRPTKRIPELYHNRFTPALKWRNTLHHQGVFYNRSCFENYRFDKRFKILGDYDLNLHLLKSGARAFHSEVLIAISDASGLSKNFGKFLYREELKVKKKHLTAGQMLIQRVWVWMKWGGKNI